MLWGAIAASVAVVLIALIAPIAANIRTPANLRDWYQSRQSLATWVAAGVALILIWCVYAASAQLL